MASYYYDVPDEVEDQLAYIMDRLMRGPATPQRDYLLQCAEWAESKHDKGRWVAYSDIYNGHSYWCLYDMDDLEYADETSIKYCSWKGDYSPERRAHAPDGNLPYDGEAKSFSGTIWTRGE